LQQLRTAVPALELWHRYVNLGRDRPVPASAATPDGTLRIGRLLLAPPGPALEVGDLILAPGELTLVQGGSGIGKSSLIDVLAGMVQPKVFTATRDGRPLDFDAYRGLVRRGAYVSQGARPWQHTVRECLQWAAAGATEETMWQALADVGLDKRLADRRHGLDTRLDHSSSRLSGGELQRLLLAQVILRKPFLALLDEATSALDAPSEARVLSTMRRRLPEAILVVVSHRQGLSAVADRCLAIEHGRATLRAGEYRVLSTFHPAKVPGCPAA
jgi:ATP-binding cassette subfamily C protein